jgi:hypothetical protein
MPQLNETYASGIDEQPQSVGVLEPGVYEAVLVEVVAKPGKVAPLWSWRYEVAPGQVGEGRTMFNNTSLSEEARWKMKETFDAFGVPANTNTDRLLGQRVKLLVAKVIAQQGKRQGRFVNEIQEVMPIGQRTVSTARTADPDDPTAPRADAFAGAGQGTAPGAGDEPPF